MRYDLRIYTIREGKMDAWISEWSDEIRPLRQKFGFEVLGPWVVDGTTDFVWILSHAGNWEEADAAYYASEERTSMEPDPARHIASARDHLMTPVPRDAD